MGVIAHRGYFQHGPNRPCSATARDILTTTRQTSRDFCAMGRQNTEIEKKSVFFRSWTWDQTSYYVRYEMIIPAFISEHRLLKPL